MTRTHWTALDVVALAADRKAARVVAEYLNDCLSAQQLLAGAGLGDAKTPLLSCVRHAVLHVRALEAAMDEDSPPPSEADHAE